MYGQNSNEALYKQKEQKFVGRRNKSKGSLVLLQTAMMMMMMMMIKMILAE
jgi:hypothetical protein